jgi:aldehyde:ferredoxin oxidoreductase
VLAAIETEDRAAIMDSMILCKFLRGVFEDPFTDWAGLLALVTGWDIDAAELRGAARRIVRAKRAFNLREGATAADDTLPARMLETPLELGSGRTATLTADRLRSMVAGYYRARGLDAEGRVATADMADLLLDAGAPTGS